MFKIIKKIIILCGACAIIFTSALICNRPFTASADGVAEIAVELNSGKVFLEKNADKRLPMASTTKIMTAYIIAEDCDLSQVITVPDKAVGVEGSSIYLTHGEQVSVKDLLYGLMLRSGNDAACALAIHHSGTIENFVKAMNEKAAALGCTNTNFSNPNGLPDENHYTTARDLCNITCNSMKNSVFREVVSTRSYTGDFKNFTNKNKLLATLEGANGVKTGYTEKAGRCLVSSAERDKMDVVCVVLNCYDMFERSRRIIENCFSEYEVKTLLSETIYNFNGVPCTLDNNYDIVIKKTKPLEYNLCESDDINAVAKLEITCENDLIFSHNLYKLK